MVRRIMLFFKQILESKNLSKQVDEIVLNIAAESLRDIQTNSFVLNLFYNVASQRVRKDNILVGDATVQINILDKIQKEIDRLGKEIDEINLLKEESKLKLEETKLLESKQKLQKALEKRLTEIKEVGGVNKIVDDSETIKKMITAVAKKFAVDPNIIKYEEQKMELSSKVVADTQDIEKYKKSKSGDSIENLRTDLKHNRSQIKKNKKNIEIYQNDPKLSDATRKQRIESSEKIISASKDAIKIAEQKIEKLSQKIDKKLESIDVNSEKITALSEKIAELDPRGPRAQNLEL